MVDEVIMYNDEDDTSCHAIHQVLHHHDSVIFANGGDRIISNIPEYERYKNDKRVKFVCGIGGDKTESSSWLLDKWKSPITYRNWGYYKELYQGNGFKIKELVINPHSSLSMQRHQYRSETWNLVSGSAWIDTQDSLQSEIITQSLSEGTIIIPKQTWHRGYNTSDRPSHIVEIWRGEVLEEEDIERRNV